MNIDELINDEYQSESLTELTKAQLYDEMVILADSNTPEERNEAIKRYKIAQDIYVDKIKSNLSILEYKRQLEKEELERQKEAEREKNKKIFDIVKLGTEVTVAATGATVAGLKIAEMIVDYCKFKKLHKSIIETRDMSFIFNETNDVGNRVGESAKRALENLFKK